MSQLLRAHAVWFVLALIAATGFGFIATAGGEQVNALWIVAAAMSVHCKRSPEPT